VYCSRSGRYRALVISGALELFLVGRADDMIIRGENVYPVEIEDMISALSAVLEIAVAGKPDPYWGEVVRTKPGVTVTRRTCCIDGPSRTSSYSIPPVDSAATWPRPCSLST